MYASVSILTVINKRFCFRYDRSVDRGPAHQRRALRRERELAELRLRLLSQLDQRTGREKAVLRRTIAALSARLRRRGQSR